MPIPTLADWLEEWSASRRHHLEASSVQSYRVMADTYLLPHLGHVPLDQLDVRSIEAAYATLLTRGGRSGRPLAPRTVAYAHAVLHRALVDAVRLGVVDANPAAAATLPRRAADGRAPRRLRVWDAKFGDDVTVTGADVTDLPEEAAISRLDPGGAAPRGAAGGER